jgi:multimeric flavodoxin WrbA
MKILSINASPNKLGSTSLLLKTTEEELILSGHLVKRFDLYDYNFKGCLGCSACLKPETNYCSQQDDLIPILKILDESDVLIFGSPIYIGHITGEGKSFIDRLYTFLGNKARSSTLKKKIFSFLITQGAELKYFESVRSYINDWFYDYFGMINGGSLTVGELGTAEDLQKRPEEIEKARYLAKEINQALQKVEK